LNIHGVFEENSIGKHALVNFMLWLYKISTAIAIKFNIAIGMF